MFDKSIFSLAALVLLAPAVAIAQEPTAGASPATTGTSQSSPAANEKRALDRQFEGQVYFLKPQVKDFNHVREMRDLLLELRLVMDARADSFSGMLVVRCLPDRFPEVEKLVKTLQEAAGSGGAAAFPRQVALDVRVILASHDAQEPATGALDPKLAEGLTKLFGYKSFRPLGTQFVQVRTGDQAVSETIFKDPRGNREFPFSLKFVIRPEREGLTLRCSIKSPGFGAQLETTLIVHPDRTVVLGNSSLKTGEALIYLVTPGAGDDELAAQ